MTRRPRSIVRGLLSSHRVGPWVVAAMAGVAMGVAHAAPPTHPESDPPPAEPPSSPVDTDAHRPVVQLAIVLDTSGSMSGLIEQAKAQLWSIVNELARSSRQGVTPELQVALFQYGTPSLGAHTGYVRRILPLTSDLDAVSHELFSLTTNGGQEYCGHAIQTAHQSLRWSPGDSDLKIIVIAGNEPFTQGSVDFRLAVPAAAGEGLIVNTIHCGNHEVGINTGWYAGAQLGNGSYSSIDHNIDADPVATPYDDELSSLSRRINTTYLAYGSRGEAMALRQASQDDNAASLGDAVAAERAATKAGSMYLNARWDLVDAVRTGTIDLETVDPASLPEQMRSMSPTQRREHIEQLASQRAGIRARIQELHGARLAFIARTAAEQGRAEGDGATLGAALLGAIREQAESVGLRFAEPPLPTSGPNDPSDSPEPQPAIPGGG